MTKTSLQRYWELKNISGNEESTIFDRSFDILASKLKSLYMQKKVKKTFGKQIFILAVKW